MKRASVNGVDLEYVDQGTGIPVVFCHGGSSDVRYWKPQREIFAARFRFVAYSQRFHGTGSWQSEAEVPADVHTSDLVAIMRRLEAGPVHLVGFSRTTAIHAALVEPHLVRSLTIVEPNAPSLLEGDPQGEAVLAWWREQNERVHSQAANDPALRAKLWFELVNNQGAHTFDDQPEAFRRMWLDNFSARRPPGPPEPLTCGQLGEMRTSTLILGAEHGMPYSRRIVERIAACVSGSRLVLVPSVTHFMSYQRPDIFNELVLKFLTDPEEASE